MTYKRPFLHALVAGSLATSLLACSPQSTPDIDNGSAAQTAPTDGNAALDLDRQTGGSPIISVGDRHFPMPIVDMYTAERAEGQSFRLLQPGDKQVLSKELVHLLLLSQQAEELGLQNNGATAAALQLQTTKVMARAALDNFFATNQPGEEELLAEYEKRRAGMYNIQLKARHILVESITEANNLIDELDAGADFSELAKTHSIDGGSGSKGGDLGWFKPAQMVKPFSEAAEALKVGERSSEAIQSNFGWHIIMIDDRKELAPPAFNEMKAAMTKFVQQGKVEAYLISLEDKFPIVIADEVSAAPDYDRDLESLSADEDHSGHGHGHD